jgi:FkbM family methyltransferase
MLETPQGPYWLASDCDISVFCDLLAEQEADIYGDADVGVRPGDTVIDCGANYGLFIRKALARGAERVVAIEPAAQNCSCIEEGFANEISGGNVILVRSAAWSTRGVLTFGFAPRYPWASAVQDIDGFMGHHERKVQRVSATTIDYVVDQLKLSAVDFIKLDIEGSECAAIEGAKNTISSFRPRIAVAIYHRPDDRTEIPARLRSMVPSYAVKCIHAGDYLTRIQREVLLFS